LRQLVIKVLNIIGARCKHDVYVLKSLSEVIILSSDTCKPQIVTHLDAQCE